VTDADFRVAGPDEIAYVLEALATFRESDIQEHQRPHRRPAAS
jgi:hypothetical protein